VSRARYPPIADHGVIGNLHTMAWISTSGTIDAFTHLAVVSAAVNLDSQLG
jgi:hypothetical protein